MHDDRDNLMSVLTNRLELHRFVIEALERFDFHWTTSDEDLSFFQSFFNLLEALILRRFFHPDYDTFL